MCVLLWYNIQRLVKTFMKFLNYQYNESSFYIFTPDDSPYIREILVYALFVMDVTKLRFFWSFIKEIHKKNPPFH